MLSGEVGLGNKHGFGAKHCFNFAQAVTKQSGAAAHNVANGLGQPDAGRNFNRPADGVQVGLHTVLDQVAAQDVRVRGGDVLALQRLNGRVRIGPGHGQAQAALAEAQGLNFEVGVAGFHQHVLTHNAEVGHAIFHIAGNVIVAQKQNFERKIGGFRLEFVRRA